MKQPYPEIKYVNQTDLGSQFDLVSYRDLLDKNPKDHNQFRFHKVPFYVIMIFTDGNGQHNINFHDYGFSKGTVLTLRKDSVHKFYKNEGEATLLIFTKQYLLSHSNKPEANKVFMLFNEMLASPKIQLKLEDLKEITPLIQQLKKEYLVTKDKYSLSIMDNLLKIILSRLLRIKSISSPLIESSKYLSNFLALQNMIEKNCFENRKVSFYANKLGLSTKSLNNATRAIAKLTAKEFINSIFIINLKRLIISSKDPLSLIAYKVGFDEPTNFFKFFKKYCGQSASSFRGNNQ